jgi:hypothetical protein
MLTSHHHNAEQNHDINYVELNSSWETAGCAAIQELLNILWKMKDH